MLYAANVAGLEVRQTDDGSAIVSGRFPYDTETRLGHGRRERFAAGAFQTADDVHLLAGHDFNRPLASRSSGSLTVGDQDNALSFEARISADVANTTHGKDALAMIRSGLIAGLSPGFTVAKGGETVERRGNDLVRTVTRAELRELSVVTVPAYSQAQVEARSWAVPEDFDAFIHSPIMATWGWR